MTQKTSLHLPRQWAQLRLDRLHGLVMIIGGPDLGKSTLARYLYRRLGAEAAGPVAYLDGDPGQSTLGPPATMTAAVGRSGDDTFPPPGQQWRSFVGAVSPRGHMLPLLVGAARLVQAARTAGAETIIYDTSGLVDPTQGGLALKLAKIDLLRPAVVVALQARQELEPLLLPLRRSRRLRVVEVQPSPARQVRDRATRQTHRAAQFARYFATARPLVVDWPQLAVWPAPHFTLNRLVALENVEGFTCGLGFVQHNNPAARQVSLLTPLNSLAGIETLRLGDLLLEPKTYRDQSLRLSEP